LEAVRGQQDKIDSVMEQANRHLKKRRKLAPSDTDTMDGGILEVL